MLNKETKAKLAALLKVDIDAFEKAIKDEKETDFELPELTAFTVEELEQRDKQTQKTGYDKGKVVGQSMLLDELKEVEGLEYEGKTKENFLAAVKKKYEGEKGKEVDQKIKDRDKIIEDLKKAVGEKETALEKVSSEFSSFKSDFEFIEALPEGRNNALTNNEWVNRLKNNGVRIEESEGKKVVRFGENIITDDKTKSPLPVGEAIANIFKQKQGWLTEEQKQQTRGTGFGDKTKSFANGVYKTKGEFDAAMAEKNISYTNQAYQVELNAALQANPEMVMSE